MDYEIVRWRPEFRDDVALLQAERWGGAQLSADYLSWKYEHNPYIHDPLIYLALAEGKIIGMRGAYGTLWKTGDDGATVCFPCLADTFVDPAHRDRGLLASLTSFALRDLAERGYPFAVNLSSGNLTALSQLAGGWRGVGRPVPLILFDVGRVLWGETAAGLGRRQDAFARFDRSHRAPDSGARATQPGPGIRHVRDEEYFAWRLRNPRSTYRVASSDDGRLVLAATPDNYRVTIADWDASGPESLQALVRDVLPNGHFGMVRVWASEPNESTLDVFRNCGFRPAPRRSRNRIAPAVFVRPTAARRPPWTLEGLDLLDPNVWHVRELDTDRL